MDATKKGRQMILFGVAMGSMCIWDSTCDSLASPRNFLAPSQIQFWENCWTALSILAKSQKERHFNSWFRKVLLGPRICSWWDGAFPNNSLRFCGHLLLIPINSGGHCSFCQTCEAFCSYLVSFSSNSNLCDQRFVSEIPFDVAAGQWHNTIQLLVELLAQWDMQYNWLTNIYREYWRFQTLADIRDCKVQCHICRRWVENTQ